MSAKIEIPPAEMAKFRAELRRYAEATKKDAAYVVNRQALNLSIKCLEETPRANREVIKNLINEPWWPKYVASVISKTGVSVSRKRKGQEVNTTIKGSYTRAQARRASKAIIKKRLKGVTFWQASWIPAIKRFAKEKLNLKANLQGAKQYGKDKGYAIVALANTWNPTAFTASTAEDINKAGPMILSRAIARVTADMKKFIDEKFGKTAKEFSAK